MFLKRQGTVSYKTQHCIVGFIAYEEVKYVRTGDISTKDKRSKEIKLLKVRLFYEKWYNFSCKDTQLRVHCESLEKTTKKIQRDIAKMSWLREKEINRQNTEDF